MYVIKFVTSKCSQVQRSKGGMMDDDVVSRGPSPRLVVKKMKGKDFMTLLSGALSFSKTKFL